MIKETNTDFSISSSNSSILQQMPTSILSFDIIDIEICHLVKIVKTNASENNLNQSRENLDQSKKNCQSQSDSINNSISNIYIKAITEKREANRQKPGAGGASGFSQAKRHSINNVISINTNPNGGNKSAPNNFDTESVKTFESEKSCY